MQQTSVHISEIKLFALNGENYCLVVFLTIIRSKSKGKGKGRGCRKYLKKEQNKEFTIIYYRRCLSMIENRISGNLCNDRFSKGSEEKSTAIPSMAWSLIVHKNTIKNCSTVLQAFFSRSLSLYPLFPFS